MLQISTSLPKPNTVLHKKKWSSLPQEAKKYREESRSKEERHLPNLGNTSHYQFRLYHPWRSMWLLVSQTLFCTKKKMCIYTIKIKIYTIKKCAYIQLKSRSLQNQPWSTPCVKQKVGKFPRLLILNTRIPSNYYILWQLKITMWLH